MDIENSFGLELRARRLLLGYSVKKLSKLAGVSRRWISCAEQGSNITVDVLAKLMRTMNMTVITICPGITGEAGLAAPGTTELAEAVAEITRSTGLSQQAVERIKSFIVGVGKSVPKDTPESEGFTERATALVTHFTEHVHSLSDPDKLQKVEDAVSGILKPEAGAQGTAKARPGRRRKSSG
ncbi:MAG TPA: helix-turn-helix domain-containing protein [Thermoanaerobaculia bacterium]|nr:helix-turn-helix domain-containing protein [Thermoanaerobaculia bacterium]